MTRSRIWNYDSKRIAALDPKLSSRRGRRIRIPVAGVLLRIVATLQPSLHRKAPKGSDSLETTKPERTLMKPTAGLLAALLTGIPFALTACGGAASSGNPLAGTSWRLQEYSDPSRPGGMTPVSTSAVPTLEFGQDDAVHGSGGCNNFHGNYTVVESALTLGPLATTMMYCEQEGIMDQESAFLSQLEGAASFRIDGGQLHVLNEEGSLIALFNAL